MPWPKPKFSRNQVNLAGQILVHQSPEAERYSWAMEVLGNWRGCHGYPINTFQTTLRNKLKVINAEKALVAQRLKRTPSIIDKLRRYREMELARMQDIGGLRAVVDSVKKVYELEKNYRETQFTHSLVRERDYIAQPKSSGYRSVHLMYEYRNKKVPEYNKLLLELQIRTKLQHTWATAVETAGTFLQYALKSSQGPEKWLKFFSLAGSAFAHLEKTTPVPGYENLSEKETYKQVSLAAKELEVRELLAGFNVAANVIEKNKKHGSNFYHLVVLDPIRRRVEIQAFPRGQLEEANKAYAGVELMIAGGKKLQAVLVSAGSIEKLKRAYPNYFLDTREFIQILNKMESRSN